MKLLALLLAAGIAGCAGAADQHAREVASSAPGAIKDGLLVAAVKARLAAANPDTTTAVGVSARDGRVRLTGAVRTSADLQRAATDTAGVPGVTSVQNDLHVDPHLQSVAKTAGDAALAARVSGELAGQTGVNALKVKVGVRDGAVTLDGSVPTPAIKTTMLQTARHVPGVRSLIDRIRVND